MLGELEHVHRRRDSVVGLSNLLVNRAGVEGGCVGVIGGHEVVRCGPLSRVIVGVEVLVSLSVETCSSEAIPPLSILALGHVKTNHGDVHHHKISAIVKAKA